MVKILLFSILLAVVYSWDDVVRLFRTILYGLFRHDPLQYYQNHTDRLVGPIVITATLPITLVGLLASRPLSLKTFAIAAITLLIVSIIAAGSGVFVRRMRIFRGAVVKEKSAAIAYAILGLLSPLASPMLLYEILPRAELARITFWLALPPLTGIAIAYGNRATEAPGQLLPHLDALTLLLVVGLIAMLATKLLARAFQSYKIEGLFSYIRIVLGIILATVVVIGV